MKSQHIFKNSSQRNAYNQRFSSSIKRNRNVTSLSEMISLSGEHPNEILLTIQDKKSGVFSLVNETKLNPDLSAHMFIIFGKACSSDMSANVSNFIQMVNCNSEHILLHMQRYLASLQKKENFEKIHLDSVLNLAIFLQKFQSTMPSSSSDFMSMLLPLLDSTCQKYLKVHKDVYCLVSEKLKEINEENQQFLKYHSLSEMRKVSEKEKLHLQEPPVNFRSLPVLPTSDDINLPCVFLRPNIVKGKYKNTEHYLDVQYRLLREDYVKPLRDGIAEYLNLKQTNQSVKNCKNVKVYTNVCIEGEDFLNGDLLHVLKFSDESFSKINWDHSKRLLTQSLLCLSLDEFKTMLFASVIRRDPKKLKEGLLYIRFEEITDEVLKLNHSMQFVVIETSAYFEAYRHNLMALQQLNGDALPLKQYIIDVQKTVNSPRYLQSTAIYDMRPLLIPLDENHIQLLDGTACYKYPENISDGANSVTILEESCWPTADDLNLDDSQYLALKAAITKEFAIIQGPPGTGKTYIGLRIVQLLLHNLNQWFSSETNWLPILIVCYTNHALDQFLEGLLLFTTKIVRIGGRCSNDKIMEYQLRDVKRFRVFPDHLSNNIYETNWELKDIKREINEIQELVEMSSYVVLNEYDLKEYIPEAHFMALVNCHSRKGIQQNGYSIYEWLGVNLHNSRSASKIYKTECDNQLLDPFELKEIIESEDEDDIEYIESQRNIDDYDFDDFSFNKNAESKDSEWSHDNSEWITPKSKKRYELTKYTRNCLECFKAMSEDIAMEVTDVWSLDFDKRWELYKFWLKNLIKEKAKESSDLQKRLKTKCEEIAEMRIEEDLYVLKTARVVGMTTNGAAKYRHLVKRLNPMILVVEEAAEVLESHIVTSLAPDTQHVILIGDQQQLRPSPTVHMLAVKYDLNISLFERMVMNGVDYCRLSVQHRMRPQIASLIVPHIYANLENHKVVTEFENIKGVDKNVFFVSHCYNESSESDSKSKVNNYEAEFLIQFCRYLILQGYGPSQITVLTTYSGQLFALKNLATGDVKKVRFTVVDNFQGEENDIILISFVRSNDDGIIGFLKVSNRVCVALSRAKKGLFCIGNFTQLAEKSNLWQNIVDTLIQNQSIGQSLRLKCQNHPDTFVEVACHTDFNQVPEGGCNKSCEYRLPCGHCCQLLCHHYDHESIECKKPCSKTCERGHNCEKKCFDECYCTVRVDRMLDECEHTVKEMCGKPQKEIICHFKCNKVLSCTHPCPNICGEICEEHCKESCLKTCKKGHMCPKQCFDFCGSCKVLVDKTLKRCGHTVKTFCGNSDHAIVCSFKCEKVLSCTHPCLKKCGERCETKCNQQCLKKCKEGHQCVKKCFESCGLCRILVDKVLVKCGHTVKVPCGESSLCEELIICSFKCEKILHCSHACTKKCGEYCVEKCLQLKEIVSPICGHTINVPCYIADSSEILLKKCTEEFFKTCPEQCKEVLPCGHNCLGICGSCYQKRLHVPCKETCERILICGHRCQSACSRSCPPCQKPCENKCIHTKCNKTCGEPCYKCKKLCEWSCSHKSCTRPCNEICDRKPCDEACMKILPCEHPCIGFCSEPCPKLCRICDNKMKNNIFYELDDDARYVLLEDCGHVFEVHGLNQWMRVVSEGEKKIRMKTCPMCKIVIRKNMRYNRVVKGSLLQIESVKQITKWNKKKNQELQSVLLQKSVSLNSFSYFKPYNNLNRCLSSYSIRNIRELTNIENIISIGTGVNLPNFKDVSSSPDLSIQPQFLQALVEYAHITSQWVTDFILKYFLTASEQQLLQLTYEVHRLRLIDRLLQYAEPKFIFSRGNSDFENCLRCVLNYAPFNIEDIKAFESAFQVLTSKFVGETKGTSTPTEFPYLKAMDMSSGHWYECLKGHAYCITEYVGTVGKGCYECLTKKNLDPLPNCQQSSATSSKDSIYRWPRLSTSEQQTGNEPMAYEAMRWCQRRDRGPSRRGQRRPSANYQKFFQRSDSSSCTNWRNSSNNGESFQRDILF